MSELHIGERAPLFELPSDQGAMVSLEDYRGKRIVVLYFYPRDDTPTCTKQACQFRDTYHLFSDAHAVVLGISSDTIQSHARFREKFNLPFPLLADVDLSVCMAYGVYKEKTLYGRKYMGIERTTFIIDHDGVIRVIFPKVKVAKHTDQVIRAIEQLSKQ